MHSPAYSARGPSPDTDASNRPLPPIPDSGMDLYSAGDDSGPVRSLSQPGSNYGLGEENQIRESRGESSSSRTMNTNVEASSPRQTFSDVKGGGMNSTGSHMDLVASQGGLTSHLSRIRSISTPIDSRRYQSSSSQSTPSSQSFQGQSRDDMNNMPFLDSSSEQPLGGRRVQQVRIMPGTVNYNIQRIRTNPQYQFTGDRVILPRWQPDSEVSACPICNSLFNVFNRKHHCRKCGKVVCASCSPHRITIPREYIVLPQSETEVSPLRIPRTSNASILAPAPGAIEGGERVRLCNPCVPDPNTAPPQSSSPPPYASGPTLSNERQVNPEDRLPMFSEYRAPGDSYQPSTHGSISVDTPDNIMNYLQELEIRARSNARRPQLEWARTDPVITHPGGNPRRQSQMPDRYRDASQGSAVASSATQAPRSNSFHTSEPHGMASSDPNTSTAGPTRRNVPEEDICPVCGCVYSEQMKTDEAQKELHVQRCIEDLSSRNRSNSQVGNAGVTRGQTEGQSSSHMRRGMTKYVGTARDAVDGDECQICLEEFMPSQELARLTCLCRYHSECIVGWWNQGQFGKCPTHDHGL